MRTRSRRYTTAIALLLTAAPPFAAHAGFFTPFKRAFGEFWGGKVRSLPGEAPHITELLFEDGKDLPFIEKTEATGTKTVVVFKITYTRAQWALLLDSKPLTPLKAETGEYEIELPIKAEETKITLTAVGPRGDVEQENRVFESYDWDAYQKERLISAQSDFRERSFTAGVSSHFIAETYAGVTTWTNAQMEVPDLGIRFTGWRGKRAESRAWAWDAELRAAYPLPLYGIFVPPLAEGGVSFGRKNLARPAIAGTEVAFSASLGVRADSFFAGGLNQTASGSATVINAFAARWTLLTWVDLVVPVEFNAAGLRFILEPRFSRTLIGYSILLGGSNAFFPGGFGAGARVTLSSLTWHPNWFATAGFSYTGTAAGSSNGIFADRMTLAVGMHF